MSHFLPFRLISGFALVALFLVSSDARAQITADAGEDQTVAAGENCEALVSLDASGSEIPEGTEVTYTWTGPFSEGEGTADGEQVEVTLGAGEHEILLSIDDGSGADPATDTVMITVEDQTAPTINSATPSEHILWPPNHKMRDIDVILDVTDNCDENVECEIVGVESNESDNGKGDGNTRNDAITNGDMKVKLRAERSGRGDGRVYTVTVRCADDSGNETTSTVEVRVPHDMRKMLDDSSHSCVVRIDFKNENNDRLRAKLDINDSLVDLPGIGDEGIGDDLAGYALSLTIAGEELTGTYDENGVIDSDTLQSRLNEDGLLCIRARGLSLAGPLGLDPDDTLKGVLLDIAIEATVTPPEGVEGVAIEPVDLFDDTITCLYKQRAHKRGKAVRRARRSRR